MYPCRNAIQCTELRDRCDSSGSKVEERKAAEWLVNEDTGAKVPRSRRRWPPSASKTYMAFDL